MRSEPHPEDTETRQQRASRAVPIHKGQGPTVWAQVCAGDIHSVDLDKRLMVPAAAAPTAAAPSAGDDHRLPFQRQQIKLRPNTDMPPRSPPRSQQSPQSPRSPPPAPRKPARAVLGTLSHNIMTNELQRVEEDNAMLRTQCKLQANQIAACRLVLGLVSTE